MVSFVSKTTLALTLSEIKIFNFLDLQKVDQGHGVQFLQLQHSMAIVKFYKCFPHIFAFALTFSEILKFKFLTYKK